ncbi:TetR family transcriptional regulator [Mycobacterium paraense]|uniref:TetR family transcriptional regulator n=1 Tax=Mycobacterium paraense TaxID=767916 RepID=A0ABX3VUJ4_9MYCO|nr:TetR/AcrR family transcriptional regulator [Mycobacterium paraense]MCV7442073.1 TetR family transcriptional regulator [Mycobacterium paraense]ORW34268.1 TetR family transcriptional regulator [Mycobacterium paraense]ORW37549.1 TetR family transcriptional regulator [Mycobacterium paraense]ORW41077.1 TetR family transcriptional regulator [Mycobacterium paraense]
MPPPVNRASAGESAPPRRNAAATRARLLQAAREQFLSQGYRATSLRAIAAAAGVDVMLIRRYFGSKEQLFAEATDVSDNVAAVHEAADGAISGVLMDRVLRARRDVDAPLFALLRSSGDPDVVARLNAQLETGLTRNLSERITADQPRLRADLVAALLLGVGVLRALLQKEPLATADDREIAALFAEAFEALTKLPQDA